MEILILQEESANLEMGRNGTWAIDEKSNPPRERNGGRYRGLVSPFLGPG